MNNTGPLHRAGRAIQVRLAVLYAAMFFLLGLIALTIPYLFGGTETTSNAVPSGGGANSQIQRAIVDAQRAADIHRQLVLSIVALVVLVVLSVVLGWIFAGRALHPLRTIASRAGEISASNLHLRFEDSGRHDELTELGATLNDLLARLESSFASQKNFIFNASHELRTPLTAERALLQVALADTCPSVNSLRSVCEDLVELGGHQEQLIDGLLTLAQSERGVEYTERFDLSTVARAAVRSRQDQASSRQIAVDFSGVPAPVVGDRRLITILLGNLMDNAIRYNVAGGHVSVRTSHRGRGSTVAVSNSGLPVSEEDVDHLCEPFMRPASTRRLHMEGHGLGLAIVHAVAHAHGAELRVRARSQGGLAVDVTFPPNGSSRTD